MRGIVEVFKKQGRSSIFTEFYNKLSSWFSMSLKEDEFAVGPKFISYSIPVYLIIVVWSA